MPKIIENVREQLLLEAKRQIAERGYTGTTVRSVASACHVGVGTVYNYFSSKDMLIATFLMEDWQAQLDRIAALPKEEPRPLLRGIYDALCGFAGENRGLFSDEAAARAGAGGFGSRHKMLRDQLASFLRGVCDGDFTADFVAEALIGWAMEGTPFDTVYGVLERVLKK